VSKAWKIWNTLIFHYKFVTYCTGYNPEPKINDIDWEKLWFVPVFVNETPWNKRPSQETPLPCHSLLSHLTDHSKIFNYLIVLFAPTVIKEQKSMSWQEHLGLRRKSIIQLKDGKETEKSDKKQHLPKISVTVITTLWDFFLKKLTVLFFYSDDEDITILQSTGKFQSDYIVSHF
jgi:hypothetical protein